MLLQTLSTYIHVGVALIAENGYSRQLRPALP